MPKANRISFIQAVTLQIGGVNNNVLCKTRTQSWQFSTAYLEVMTWALEVQDSWGDKAAIYLKNLMRDVIGENSNPYWQMIVREYWLDRIWWLEILLEASLWKYLLLPPTSAFPTIFCTQVDYNLYSKIRRFTFEIKNSSPCSCGSSTYPNNLRRIKKKLTLQS